MNATFSLLLPVPVEVLPHAATENATARAKATILMSLMLESLPPNAHAPMWVPSVILCTLQ